MLVMTAEPVEADVKRKMIKTQHPNSWAFRPGSERHNELKASLNRPPTARLYFQLIREYPSLLLCRWHTGKTDWVCVKRRRLWSSVVGQHRAKLRTAGSNGGGAGQAAQDPAAGSPPLLCPQPSPCTPRTCLSTCNEGEQLSPPGNLIKLLWLGAHQGQLHQNWKARYGPPWGLQ